MGRGARSGGGARGGRWAAARCGASVGRRGGGGCEATRRAAGCKRGAGRHAGRQGWGARRRGEHCRAQARRGHGERDCGTGTARALGGARRVACGGGGAASKTTHLRRALATNRPELALSAIRTASRMKAMRFGRLYALPPPNSINRKPNRHRRRPILCILIRFAESQNADRTLMRVWCKGDRIVARTTIREGGGDDTRGRGRCTRAGAMRGPNTTKRQLKDGTQLQSLWSDRRTRPESPKPRGEGLSPIGTIRFGGV